MSSAKGRDLLQKLDRARQSKTKDAGCSISQPNYEAPDVEANAKIPVEHSPEKKALLLRYGIVHDAPRTHRMAIRARSRRGQPAFEFPVFAGYFNLKRGWAVIEHAYFYGEHAYGDRPVRGRTFMSQWLFLFWRALSESSRSSKPGPGGELPPLRTVVVAHIVHAETERLLEVLSSPLPQQQQARKPMEEGLVRADGAVSGPGALDARTGAAVFQDLFGPGVGSFIVRALTDHHNAFRNVRPVAVAWRYGRRHAKYRDVFIGHSLEQTDVFIAIELA